MAFFKTTIRQADGGVQRYSDGQKTYDTRTPTTTYGNSGFSSKSNNLSGMVVPGSPQKNVTNNYNYQGYMDLFSNPQTQSQWPFRDIQLPNKQYAPLKDVTREYRGIQETPTAPLAQPYPEMPVYNIQYPEYPTYSGMSREEALRQASGQIDPLAELAQMNLNDTYAQQRARLPQYLNARGQLHGGLRAGGEAEITNEQAMALDKSRQGFEAQKQDVASALQQQDQARAKDLADRQYQSELNNANLAMQKWQTDMTNYTRSRDESNRNAQWLANYQLQLDAAKRLSNQDAYQREQDQFQNDLALAGLTGYYNGQPTMDYTRMQYDTSKPYYSPNTGGGGLTAYQQYQIGRNSQQDAASVQKDLYDRALEMAKADPRLGMPDDNSTNTLSQLVDAYLKQLQSMSGGGTMSDADLMQYLR